MRSLLRSSSLPRCLSAGRSPSTEQALVLLEDDDSKYRKDRSSPRTKVTEYSDGKEVEPHDFKKKHGSTTTTSAPRIPNPGSGAAWGTATAGSADSDVAELKSVDPVSFVWRQALVRWQYTWRQVWCPTRIRGDGSLRDGVWGEERGRTRCARVGSDPAFESERCRAWEACDILNTDSMGGGCARHGTECKSHSCAGSCDG